MMRIIVVGLVAGLVLAGVVLLVSRQRRENAATPV
jgi:hypothetical protein